MGLLENQWQQPILQAEEPCVTRLELETETNAHRAGSASVGLALPTPPYVTSCALHSGFTQQAGDTAHLAQV